MRRNRKVGIRREERGLNGGKGKGKKRRPAISSRVFSDEMF
jgi:hypothetical protein